MSTVNAEIDQVTCADYDVHYVTSRNEVSQFVAWYEAGQEDALNGTNKQATLFPDYSIPRSIIDWPAHGRNFEPYNEDYYLAPFVDRDGDGNYNPAQGDYPAYDLSNASDCKAKIINIFGDQNLWWVFNDKGNVHTETGSGAIGMEIRAQAFAFATNDEVNNMTFYNYELINRSTFTLTETYFGQWVDADLGCSQDDYVGCDVQRGLGFAYNGDEYDEDCRGATGYGSIPPAIGVDFFQGPFQDPDGKDNPLTLNYSEAIAQDGIPYAGIGIGYGDGVIDNERFGMRKFLYHNNAQDVRGDPNNGVEYYNYLRSIWRDGSRMVYGGTGHVGSGGSIQADYMFPDNTDPVGWGTGGNPQPAWTEVTAGNTKGDRRFMQSAGPFTLEPGAVNNITVGVVWARATNGNQNESVEVMRKADDKTQALFDNCFQLLNGPDAPDLTIQEFENRLVLYLNNTIVSNNYNEEYDEQDPTIIPPDSVPDGDSSIAITPEISKEYKTYRFQGYKIYQIVDNTVSPSDLDNIEKARLIAQVDIKDSVSRLVNFYFDADLGAEVPKLEVDGNNEGISKSFEITQDVFAEGDNKLINNKAYYFMAIAYAYNGNSRDRSYLGSRQSPTGAINPVQAIPHKTQVQNGGTILNSKYGDGVILTRIEGTGNGGNYMNLSQTTINEILENGKADHLVYEQGQGPINIKVVDPLNVKADNYTIWFEDTTTNGNLSDAYWRLTGDALGDTITATKSIEIGTETILFDLGLSIELGQGLAPGSPENLATDNGLLGAEFTFAEPSKAWLSGVPDQDGFSQFNWILCGTQATMEEGQTPQLESAYDDWNYYQKDVSGNAQKKGMGLDDLQIYEGIFEGTVAPFRLTAHKSPNGAVPGYLNAVEVHGNRDPLKNLWQYDSRAYGDSAFFMDSVNMLQYVHGVDIVLTPNKDLWTRCPVFEMSDALAESEGDAIRGQLRDAPSVDKDGNPAGTDALPSTDPNDPAYIGGKGMGWFPGYAIDVETGERLNMAFSENSYLIAENGRDMLWNPTSTLVEGPQNEFRGGGIHYIYVFRNNKVEDEVLAYDFIPPGLANSPFFNLMYNDPANRQPAYDAGAWMYSKMNDVRGELDQNNADDLVKLNNASHVFRSGMWTIFPRLEDNTTLLATEATVKLRVSTPYQNYGTGNKFLSKGDKLEVGKEYYVNAGPIKHVTSPDVDSMYYPGMTLIAGNTDFKLEYMDIATAPKSLDTTDVLMEAVNGGRPLYNFSTHSLAPSFNNTNLLESSLDEIRVVPNPYYAYSRYETDKIDTRVRITNLPQSVTVRIYTVNGTLVRTLKKDDDTITFLEWDLKNQSQVPIASGVYVMHVEAPGVGEKILKWMGVMRPVDLDNF
ncbi:hypothetical protein KFE98_10790 [bacterium SCSIO 12741]|nr:hypothetical protein KFE98_10790 [bacterium SCSIO 12741]